MTPREIVVRVLFVEGALGALLLAAILGCAAWHRHARSRRTAWLQAGRAALLTALSRTEAPAELDVLRRIPRRVLVRLLSEIAPSVLGPERATLGALAEGLGLTRAAARALRSVFWWRRLHGARMLTLVMADSRPLAGLEGDRHPLVRCQRAEAHGQHPSREAADELIALSADPDPGVRFAARDALMRCGALAHESLARRLEHPDGSDVSALLDVAVSVAAPRFLSAALAHSASPSPIVRVRSARLLGAIGSRTAVDRLATLLEDDSAEVRATAAAAIGALAHWPAAAALARRLDDTDWDVRVAAAVALQRLGAPGTLLLRRARHADGPGAAVAAQVLGVAEQLAVVAAR